MGLDLSNIVDVVLESAVTPNFLRLRVRDTTFDLSDGIDQLNPAKDERLDASNLDDEFNRQPFLVKSYLCLIAEAEAKESVCEQCLEIVYAELDARIRANAVSIGEKTTEPKIKAQIISDPDYLNAKLQLINATKEKKLLKAMEKALDHKLHALNSESANRRKVG